MRNGQHFSPCPEQDEIISRNIDIFNEELIFHIHYLRLTVTYLYFSLNFPHSDKLLHCFHQFFFIFIISCYKPSPLPLIIYTPVQNIAPKNFKILLKKNIDSFAALIYLLTLEKNQAWLAGEVDMGRRHAFKHFNLLTALRDIICKQKKVWNIGKHASQEIRLDIHQKAGLRTWRIWIL